MFVIISIACILFAVDNENSKKNKEVVFPVLSDMKPDINNPEIILQNPVENKGKYILRYEFVNTVTEDVFFSTNWLEGGKQYHYSLDGLSGTILCRVHIYAKDADTYEDVSGVNIFIKIGVKSYEA